MEASSHTTELGMYAAKSDRITGTSIWLAIGNDLVYQIVDFDSGKRVSRAIA